MVVAFQPVHFHDLNANIFDEQTGTEHSGRCHHKSVGKLGADHDQRIQPVTAVYGHGRVDVILDKVSPSAGIYLGQLARIGLGPLKSEGPHGKRVVPVVPIQNQDPFVPEDHEDVIPVVAVDGGGFTHPNRQESARGFHRGGFIPGSHFELFTGGLEHLADLELIGPFTAVYCRHNRVVVKGEIVVSLSSMDDHALVDRAVVIDSFGPLSLLISGQGDQRHKVFANQETIPDFRVVRSVNCHEISSLAITARIINIDDGNWMSFGNLLAGEINVIIVRPFFPVES